MARRRYALKFKEGAPLDEEFIDFIDSMFAELNISPDHAQHMADRWQVFVGQRVVAEAANTQREIDALKTELGANYTASIAAGQKAARTLGLSSRDLARLDGELGVPATLRLLAKVGARLDGAGTPAADGKPTGGTGPLSSPEMARAEIDRRQRSPEWAEKLFNAKAEGHMEARREWDALHAAAWPAPEPGVAPHMPAAAAGEASRAAATAKINELIGNAGFMGSLSDPKHPEHRTNREAFDNLHAEAGITR